MLLQGFSARASSVSQTSESAAPALRPLGVSAMLVHVRHFRRHLGSLEHALNQQRRVSAAIKEKSEPGVLPLRTRKRHS